MKENPLVAIIVLNYNGKECLPLALRSLEMLTYEPKRIIVVDNGSKDDSFDRAKKDFPEGVFLRNVANVGFAAGMNVGIREAFRLNAKYVWLFNNDASTDASALTEMVLFCESRMNVGAVSPVITDVRGNEWFGGGSISYGRMRASHVPRHTVSLGSDNPSRSEYLSGCALFLPSAVLQKVGLLDERYFLYYEDVDLSVRIRKSGKELFVIPRARVAHAEQSEANNPEKLYHLVYSGLLFFHEQTPKYLRPMVWIYERLRRWKNIVDVWCDRENARSVARAYREYDRRKHESS
jgi:GT2 family glycosyltransferase